jgi:hypothetical protein
LLNKSTERTVLSWAMTPERAPESNHRLSAGSSKEGV